MDTWLLWLNVKKCKTVSFGRRTDILNEYTVSDKFDEHIDIKINKAYQMLGIIKRNYIYLTPHSFVILYKALSLRGG